MALGEGDRRLPEGWSGRFVTAMQAAEFLSVHVRTVHRYAAEGRLRGYRISGSRAVRFLREDVEALIDGGAFSVDPDDVVDRQDGTGPHDDGGSSE